VSKNTIGERAIVGLLGVKDPPVDVLAEGCYNGVVNSEIVLGEPGKRQAERASWILADPSNLIRIIPA
jgi:hypothetical protein